MEGSSLEREGVLAENTVALEEIAWEENEDGSISICKYMGNAQKLKIPKMIVGRQGLAVSVGSIGDSAFYDCKSLVRIEIPAGVKTIGWLAFRNCISLTQIELPDSIERIDDSAFQGCESLVQLKLPCNVRSIGNLAFEGCENLVKIGIPASVDYIGKVVFGRCSHLEKITVDQRNPYYETDDMGVLYNKGKTVLICCPAGKTEINILSGVSVIGDYAFCGCTSLVRIEIPRSVGWIVNFAFCDCSKLEEIVVDQNNLSYETDDAGVLYNKGKTTLICCPAGKTEIRIPMDVSFIEYGAFEGCESLKDVYYAGSREQWDAIDVDVFERDLLELAVIHYGHRSL